jgi:uncharacterized membrane protein
VFEEIAGLPMHPLTVHAAVVFVPLLVLVSLAYALVPRVRPKVAWAAVTLAVVAPVTAAVAALSGDAFQQRRGLPLEGALLDHRNVGYGVLFTTLLLAVATLALVWTRSRNTGSPPPGWLVMALTVVLVIAAVGATVTVVVAGHSGSQIVWEPLWPSGG